MVYTGRVDFTQTVQILGLFDKIDIHNMMYNTYSIKYSIHCEILEQMSLHHSSITI